MEVSFPFDTSSYSCDTKTDIGQVSTLCVHAFSVHFYLRNCYAKNYTSVIAIVRNGYERVKFSIGIQVQPWLWDKKNERLRPINIQCLENNKQINQYRYLIEELFISLRCIKRIKAHFSDMAKINSKQKLKDINIECILRKAFRSYYEELEARKKKIKESSKDNNTHQLNKLCRLIHEMGKNNSQTFLSNGYEHLKSYLIDTVGYTSGADQKLALFARLLNHVRTKPDYIRYSIEHITHSSISTQVTFKDALTTDEIRALENINLDNVNESNARYLFLIEAECGSRNCDISQIISLVKDLEVGNLKAYKETKEGRTGVAVNTENLQFYISQLTDSYKSMSCTHIDKLLKRVAKKAELNRVIPTMKNQPLCKKLSTHFGRHTFITNMRRKGYSPEEVILFTGHASADMVKKYMLIYRKKTMKMK